MYIDPIGPEIIIEEDSEKLEYYGEEEEIVFASQCKKVSSKTIQHLLQHSENIMKIEDDGNVVPSKLLNVYLDETFKTYFKNVNF